MLASSPAPVKDLKVVSFNGNTAEITWTASPEKGVKQYLVAFGAGEKQMKQIKVRTPQTTLKDVKPGMMIRVKAVNSKGLESWDWARTKLPMAQP
jgi:tartrate dehydratase alpha subunit/fumarate hydratase class I-like protein